MDLLKNYSRVFFDFDGLLVDTENSHYKAYKKAIAHFGLLLNWSHKDFITIAHTSSYGLREEIEKLFPTIFDQISWKDFYALKSHSYLESLKDSPPLLMPGSKDLINKVQKNKTPHAVVTNSPKQQIEIIKFNHPILQKIPLWITREDYQQAKPHPDGYLKAIEILGETNAMLGFEDSYKGIISLNRAKITSVLVCQKNYPQLATPSEAICDYVFSELNEIKEKG